MRRDVWCEDDQVIGIEVLNVQKSGIDPLTLHAIHHTSDQDVERPDPEAIRQGRIAPE